MDEISSFKSISYIQEVDKLGCMSNEVEKSCFKRGCCGTMHFLEGVAKTWNDSISNTCILRSFMDGLETRQHVPR